MIISSFDQFLKAPLPIRHASRHCWRPLECTVNPHEIVIGDIQGDRGWPSRNGWVAEQQEGAFVSVFGQRGVSPLQVNALRPVSESNCVVVRRGGKQLEENDQSVTVVNSIRPGCLASLPSYGEAQTDESRKPMTLRGSV